MSKIHLGSLLNRFQAENGELIIRTQNDRGQCLDVKVKARHADAAKSICGKGTVRYEYRGGRAFFTPHEELDNQPT